MVHAIYNVGQVTVQLVEALRYEPGGREFELEFFIDIILSAALRPWGRLSL